MAAFLHNSFKSEPEQPSVAAANLSMEKSEESLVSFKICDGFRVSQESIWDSQSWHTKDRIFVRCSRSGRPTAKRLGILRRMAESISFGLLVAPRTRILSVPDSNPSQRLSVSREGQHNNKKHKCAYVMNSAFIIPVTS